MRALLLPSPSCAALRFHEVEYLLLLAFVPAPVRRNVLLRYPLPAPTTAEMGSQTTARSPCHLGRPQNGSNQVAAASQCAQRQHRLSYTSPRQLADPHTPRTQISPRTHTHTHLYSIVGDELPCYSAPVRQLHNDCEGRGIGGFVTNATRSQSHCFSTGSFQAFLLFLCARLSLFGGVLRFLSFSILSTTTNTQPSQAMSDANWGATTGPALYSAPLPQRPRTQRLAEQFPPVGTFAPIRSIPTERAAAELLSNRVPPQSA